MAEFPTAEQLVASAAKFLIEGGEEDAASVLLACSIEDISVYDEQYKVGVVTKVSLSVRGPRAVYDVLINDSDPLTDSIQRAIRAVLPHEVNFDYMSVRADLTPVEPDWHAELLELARGKSVHNQAADADAARTWNGLRFRSITEIKIATALDDAGVLFFPLCKARLNGPRGRVNREPDFLVCKDGRWGILEVDGEPYHPPSRTVHDHERDRLFQRHGVRVVSHYDSTDCYTTPGKVVAEFLGLLDRAY